MHKSLWIILCLLSPFIWLEFSMAPDEQVRKDGGVPTGKGDGCPFSLDTFPDGHRSLGVKLGFLQEMVIGISP